MAPGVGWGFALGDPSLPFPDPGAETAPSADGYDDTEFVLVAEPSPDAAAAPPDAGETPPEPDPPEGDQPEPEPEPEPEQPPEPDWKAVAQQQAEALAAHQAREAQLQAWAAQQAEAQRLAAEQQALNQWLAQHQAYAEQHLSTAEQITAYMANVTRQGIAAVEQRARQQVEQVQTYHDARDLSVNLRRFVDDVARDVGVTISEEEKAHIAQTYAPWPDSIPQYVAEIKKQRDKDAENENLRRRIAALERAATGADKAGGAGGSATAPIDPNDWEALYYATPFVRR
jgi:hypothetical protein